MLSKTILNSLNSSQTLVITDNNGYYINNCKIDESDNKIIDKILSDLSKIYDNDFLVDFPETGILFDSRRVNDNRFIDVIKNNLME